MLTENKIDALKLLHTWTRQTFDVWQLAGSHNTPSRQKIMILWEGKPVPRAKCGVNAMRDAFHAAFNIEGPACGFTAQDAFTAKAVEVTGLPLRA